MGFHGAMTPQFNKDKKNQPDAFTIFKEVSVLSSLSTAVIAMAANASLKGLTGAVGALCIGAVAATGAVVSAVSAAVLGLGVLGVTAFGIGKLSKFINKRPVNNEKFNAKKIDKIASALARTFAIAVMSSYVAGGVAGYKLSRDFVIKNFDDKKIQEFFNKSSSPKNVEIDRNNFKATIKATIPSL